MPVVTTIKLTGDNHKDVDMVCATIKAISDKSGVALRGPIPLPTRKLVVPCRKAPDGEGAETWDHWEMRFHKRSHKLNFGVVRELFLCVSVCKKQTWNFQSGNNTTQRD